MSETPDWFDEDMRDGILIVGIYFKVLKDYVQNEARKWLKDALKKRIEKYAEEVEPLEYALTRYISYDKKKGKAGKAKGGEYKFRIRNAKPELYKQLFEFLEEKKNSGTPEWFGDYYVLVSKMLVKEVISDEW